MGGLPRQKPRANKINVPGHWLVQCRRWARKNHESLSTLGPKLARSIRRDEPFSKATLSRYLRGMKVTDDLTRAFARLMKVPYPVLLPRSDDQRRWAELGSRLDKSDHALFLQELENLEKLVEASEKVASLRSHLPRLSRRNKVKKR